MDNAKKFYINGEWVDPIGTETLDVINPATEEPICAIALGSKADVDRAVAAAKAAFETFSQTTREERIALLEKVIACYKARMGDIAAAVSQEMGAPVGLANAAQAPAGLGHLMYTLNALKEFPFEQMVAGNKIVREPIGVCGLITPWNWPLNQIAAKVGPALAAGCTMVLKPTEIAPMNALLFAEVMHEAGVPAGVFNLVNGTGPEVGVAMSSHPDIDMMSFTGSTRAGISVAQEAAKTVKRVTQELGGKSPNIILDDADFAAAVSRDMAGMCMNTGQSCNAPTRMLVPEARMDEAAAIAKATAEAIVVGDPSGSATQVGPLVSQMQFDKVQALIQKGIDEGAKLQTGGVGRPDGMNRGYFVKPTVFSHVTNDMTIAQEEIFGPVLSLIGYKDEEDAVRIANDTVYGLSAYISGSPERAKAVAAKLRAGNVHLNGAGVNPGAPFGGYKQSGNGREFSVWGLEEFLETKAVLGFDAA
ncbi:MAG: aldehyde dehydrogenase family protein [Pseudomonadales bacterium]|nr:aldehyde dehydrogenase family protein [Pseudomonadales bacterium]MBL6807597.1 aldehyde dehydrogenase family protein [Pseudomonadales bacterium]